MRPPVNPAAVAGLAEATSRKKKGQASLNLCCAWGRDPESGWARRAAAGGEHVRWWPIPAAPASCRPSCPALPCPPSLPQGEGRGRGRGRGRGGGGSEASEFYEWNESSSSEEDEGSVAAGQPAPVDG